MMLVRQKAMAANIIAISLIIILATLAYGFAAERIEREHLSPQTRQTFVDLVQLELSQHNSLTQLRPMLERITRHHQITEAALYNSDRQRLVYSYDHVKPATLPTALLASTHQQPSLSLYKIITPNNEQLTLALVSQTSLPYLFLLDLFSTGLFVICVSALIIFGLYLQTRHWQQQPYHDILSSVNRYRHSRPDEAISITTSDPDIKPLADALNDLLWLRDQHYSHLKSAHQQAENARQRAIRLSDETRLMNNNLAHEVSVRREVEGQLKNTQVLLDSILNVMPSAIFTLDVNQRVVQCNQQAGQWLITDPQQLIGRDFLALLPEFKDHTIFTTNNSLSDSQIKRIHLTSISPPITADVQRYMMPDSQQAHCVIRIDDVSQRQRMEEIMVQTEKMMSLGGLAAGMAHEINNPLGAVLQNIQNIRRRLQKGLTTNQTVANKLNLTLSDIEHYIEQREIFRFLDNIQSAGERAANIVSSMLQFSRNDNLQKRYIKAAELIQNTLTVIANDNGIKKASISIDVDTQLPHIYCVPSEIEQVLLNLVKNASQAFLFKEKQSENCQALIHLKASMVDDFVCISVSDNGPGIPDSDAAHIFEPFYTTKEVGEGTGLGLSVSYFIITSHHQGKLHYKKSSYGGAEFSIYLPV